MSTGLPWLRFRRSLVMWGKRLVRDLLPTEGPTEWENAPWLDCKRAGHQPERVGTLGSKRSIPKSTILHNKTRRDRQNGQSSTTKRKVGTLETVQIMHVLPATLPLVTAYVAQTHLGDDADHPQYHASALLAHLSRLAPRCSPTARTPGLPLLARRNRGPGAQ